MVINVIFHLILNVSLAATNSDVCSHKAHEFVAQLECKETMRFIGGQKYLSYKDCGKDSSFLGNITNNRIEAQGNVSTHFLCTVREESLNAFKISDYRVFPKNKSWPQRSTTRIYTSGDLGSKLYLKAANGEEVECTSSEKHDPEHPKNITWQKCFYKKNEIKTLRMDQLAAIYDGRFSVEEAIKLPEPINTKTCDPKIPGDCQVVEPNIPAHR